jgi:long-chain acyl-CoA synthetase
MIIRGGFNVYPRELEEVMMAHEAIAQVAVVGVPHESHGEEVKAVVVLKPGRAPRPTTSVPGASSGWRATSIRAPSRSSMRCP